MELKKLDELYIKQTKLEDRLVRLENKQPLTQIEADKDFIKFEKTEKQLSDLYLKIKEEESYLDSKKIKYKFTF